MFGYLRQTVHARLAFLVFSFSSICLPENVCILGSMQPLAPFPSGRLDRALSMEKNKERPTKACYDLAFGIPVPGPVYYLGCNDQRTLSSLAALRSRFEPRHRW